MMKLAQRVENRELRRLDVGLGVMSGFKIPLPVVKSTLMNPRGEGRQLDTNTMQTITLCGVSTLGNRREGPAKRRSNAKFQAKRGRGLCFKCEEQYVVGHWCKNRELRELRVLVVAEDVNELEVFEEEDNKGDQVEWEMIKIEEEIQTVAEFSINSVVGLNNSRKMKTKGKIRDEVTVLIDGVQHIILLRIS